MQVKVRDIWLGVDLGVFSTSFTTPVPPHGTAFLRMVAA
jgi:hypothetical protein